jgi:hypothetical protein
VQRPSGVGGGAQRALHVALVECAKVHAQRVRAACACCAAACRGCC